MFAHPHAARAHSHHSGALAFGLALAATLVGCGTVPPPVPKPAIAAPPKPSTPCFTLHGGTELRAPDAQKMLVDLVANIRFAPEDEALRAPKSMKDVKAILRRDLVYFFASGAAYARSLGTLEGRLAEAQLELLLGDSMLVASQVLSNQAAWVGGHLRVARANLAGEGAVPSTDRGRMLAQLIVAVEEGNKIADALGVVAPLHLARGAELVRELRKEAPNDVRTALLLAEYHRLRGEWTEFDVAMRVAEGAERSPALCYLKAMEQLERFQNPQAATSALRDCLRTRPKFVRAQAALVLVAARPEAGARELARLKQMDEDHYLVMLLEPTIAANQELLRMSGAKVDHAP